MNFSNAFMQIYLFIFSACISQLQKIKKDFKFKKFRHFFILFNDRLHKIKT